MNREDAFIDSAGAVRKALKESIGMDASLYEIKRVMHEDLSMKCKKVIPISVHGNSGKNMVLRHQYANHLIQLLM